ncbi:hypothetical protein [Sphingomonas sp.]|uniref:hypothetical protein n=1 Tax=Sphingomonas sp. TaxID=28214 RepID=UPI003341907B
MALDDRLVAALRAVAEVMAAAHDPWWIIASAAVALHGADAGVVADVDVLLSRDDALRIMPTIGLEVVGGSASAMFRSGIFTTWRGAALPVEFMADFAYRSGPDWVTFAPTTRRAIDVSGTTVFVPERGELHQLLLAFGRPKDLARARSLEALGAR